MRETYRIKEIDAGREPSYRWSSIGGTAAARPEVLEVAPCEGFEATANYRC
jgi:hypothetical protein